MAEKRPPRRVRKGETPPDAAPVVVPPDAKYLTIAEVAAELRISVDVVWRLRKLGKAPPAIKLPGGKQSTVLFPRDQLDAWVRRCAEQQGAAA